MAYYKAGLGFEKYLCVVKRLASLRVMTGRAPYGQQDTLMILRDSVGPLPYESLGLLWLTMAV